MTTDPTKHPRYSEGMLAIFGTIKEYPEAAEGYRKMIEQDAYRKGAHDGRKEERARIVEAVRNLKLAPTRDETVACIRNLTNTP